MVPTSFMSEHTAEYALVNNIIGILSPHYERIVPIYLWLTREGNKKGVASLSRRQFGLLAIYPRRPKVHSIGQEPLFVKINDPVLVSSMAYQMNNIPVFAGIPLVADLSSYDLNTPCVWFELLGHEYPGGDSHLKLSLSGELLEPLSEDSAVVGPIDEVLIKRTVLSKLRKASWEEWVEVIRDVNKTSLRRQGRSNYWFWGNYKPFYLLLSFEP